MTNDITEFLTSRRAKITPDQAGLPTYGKRRVPGLRREEVASLARIGIDYYRRLERGNVSGVSDSVLEALASALQLDDAERAHLYDLARAVNPYDRGLSDLVGELSTRSGEFRTRWAAHNVRFHQTGTKRIHHPVVGDLELSYETMELSADSGLNVTVYTAEPESASEHALDLLASWTATPDHANTTGVGGDLHRH